GTWSVPTRRISYQQTRLVGVTADAERLYVLVWHSGRVFDRPPRLDEEAVKGTYRLSVYWLADSSKIAERDLTGREVPAKAPKETTGKGPLTVADGTVSCYGTKFQFKGKEEVKPSEK